MFKFLYVIRRNGCIYEGCPRKSWTFVITRDFVSGILLFLLYVFIYI